MRFLLIALSLVLLTPNFIHTNFYPNPLYDNKEEYDPSLLYINTLEKLQHYTDSIAARENIAFNSLKYVEVISKTLRQRFYLGYSQYSLNQNWIAACSGYFFWYDLACMVKPEEIIQYPYAACSQQSLIFMWLLRQKHITYRSIKLPHHYTLEVLIGNHWYFFDTTLEPNINGEERMMDHWNNQADSLKRFYHNQDSNLVVQSWFDNHVKFENGKVNNIPALHARIFHTTTYILSKIAWIFPLLLLFFYEKKQKRKNRPL